MKANTDEINQLRNHCLINLNKLPKTTLQVITDSGLDIRLTQFSPSRATHITNYFNKKITSANDRHSLKKLQAELLKLLNSRQDFLNANMSIWSELEKELIAIQQRFNPSSGSKETAIKKQLQEKITEVLNVFDYSDNPQLAARHALNDLLSDAKKQLSNLRDEITLAEQLQKQLKTLEKTYGSNKHEGLMKQFVKDKQRIIRYRLKNLQYNQYKDYLHDLKGELDCISRLLHKIKKLFKLKTNVYHSFRNQILEAGRKIDNENELKTIEQDIEKKIKAFNHPTLTTTLFSNDNPTLKNNQVTNRNALQM